MNAVVLTAVLSCLNSGMYTASRMLFVLAARREAPLQLVNVTKRGVPGRRHPRVVDHRLPLRHRRCGLARHRLRVPAELQRRHHPVRLLPHRHLPDRAAAPQRVREPAGEDVAVPGAVDLHRPGDHRDPGADGHPGGFAVAADPEPAVLGGRDRVLLREQVVHRPSPGAGGARSDGGAAPGPGAGQRDRRTPKNCSTSCAASAPTVPPATSSRFPPARSRPAPPPRTARST